MPPRKPPARTARNRYGAEGARWRRMTAHVTGRDAGLCHICGHPGAKVVDHVIPVTERPDLALDVSNMRAAHGYLKGGGGECATCSAASMARGGKPVYCNDLRQAMSVERARRVIESRTGLPLGQKTREQPRGEREWD